LGQPDPSTHIKGVFYPFPSFFQNLSLSSSLLLRRSFFPSQTLTLIRNSVQNPMNRSLKASSHRSEYELTIDNHIRPLDRRKSWVLLTDSKGFGSSFPAWIFLNHFVYESVGLQRLLLVVNPWILTLFRKFSFVFRVCWFEPKLFESAVDLRRFRFNDASKQERGEFRFLPVFISEIWTEILGNSWIGFCFVNFWLEFRK